MKLISRRSNKKINDTKIPRKKAGKKIAIIIFVIVFLCAAGFGGWYYYWVNHTTFDYDLQPVVILDGQTVSSRDFLSSSGVNNSISISFKSPQATPGEGKNNIPVTLTQGARSLDASAELYILTPVTTKLIEFAESLPPFKAEDFISNIDIVGNIPIDVHFVIEPQLPEEYPVGEVVIQLSLNDTPFSVPLIVEDTTAPAAYPGSVEIKIGEEAPPSAFISDLFDASHDEADPPLVSFVNEPDFTSRSDNDQIVEIKAEDKYGNYEIFHAVLRIQLNETPPVIEGTGPLNTMVGNPIVFLDGITAFDDFGRDIERDLGRNIEIINNNVNINEEGVYNATYRVEDLSGLYTEITVDVYVLSIDPEYVNQRVDEALEDILSAGMTQVEQAKAIHGWVRRSISDSGTRGEPPTLYEAAYRALRDRRGNCYNFYAISAVMLTRAEIPNMQIDRVPGYQYNHRWNLINPDGLGWHHFDTRSPLESINDELYMFTASQAERFSRLIAESRVGRVTGYYHYDPNLYPPIVQ